MNYRARTLIIEILQKTVQSRMWHVRVGILPFIGLVLFVLIIIISSGSSSSSIVIVIIIKLILYVMIVLCMNSLAFTYAN